EQRRLLSPGTRLDLQDHVAAIVRIARQQQFVQPGGRLVHLLLQRAHLLGEGRVVLGEFAGGAHVLGGLVPGAVRPHDAAQFGIAPPEPPGTALIGVHLWIGELLLHLGVLGQQRLHRREFLSHYSDRRLGVVFCTVSRNSAFEEVPRSLRCSSSMACCWSNELSRRRSFHMMVSSSCSIRTSSRRVPGAFTSTAGKSRLSASCRDSRSSMFPVPLNSSKITSSIFEPVSTSAEARMVSDPPCSMLRAAPKNFFGGYSAEASTPPESIRPEVGPERL